MSMTLDEAAGAVQSLRNLFRGLERLDEVIVAAQQAVTVSAEKQALIDAKTAELADVSAKLDAAKLAALTETQAATKDAEERRAALNASLDQLLQGFEDAKAKIASDLAARKADHDTTATALSEEIRLLTQNRDSLAQSVADLQAQLAQLKDRAASL
jgi:chromosome segregation ATPase